jgi:Type II secretion system (T2SS), protein E, N-terminal domain
MPSHPDLGPQLLSAGVVDAHQLQAAISFQQQWGCELGEACIQLRFGTEEEIWSAVARIAGVGFVHLGGRIVDPKIVRRIPEKLQRSRRIVPFDVVADVRPSVLCVATNDPWNLALLDEVAFVAGGRVRCLLAGARDIESTIEVQFGRAQA